MEFRAVASVVVFVVVVVGVVSLVVVVFVGVHSGQKEKRVRRSERRKLQSKEVVGLREFLGAGTK